VEGDAALEVDGIAEIVSGGEEDGTAEGRRGRVDVLVDGGSIEGFSVSGWRRRT
jgi:hypothetical protein